MSLCRRNEKERRLKQRKREWMVKMYRDSPTGGGPGPNGLELDQLDLDQLDPLAEDLLNWTEHLDFDSYVGDWTSMACTLGSEAFVPEDEGPYLSEAPAPSHDLRGAMHTAGVPLAPFKGGVSAATGSLSSTNLR